MNLLEQEAHPHSNYLIAYAAGYFDGEGCVWISSRIRSPQLRISVVSGDHGSLEVFSKLFGGDVLPVTSKSSKLNIFRWSKDNHAAVVCLEKMLPYLRAKRDQAQMVVSSGWPTLPRGSILPREEIVRRLDLRSALRDAKRIGLKIRAAKVEVLSPPAVATGECRNCGAVFTMLRRTRKYCSLKCNKQFTGKARWIAKRSQQERPK